MHKQERAEAFTGAVWLQVKNTTTKEEGHFKTTRACLFLLAYLRIQYSSYRFGRVEILFLCFWKAHPSAI